MFLFIAIILLVLSVSIYAYGYSENDRVFKWIGYGLLILSIVSAVLWFNTEGAKKGIKHIISDTKGLNRVVEQFDYNGKLLNRYEGDIMVEMLNNGVSFIDKDGKEVKLIGGVITVKEK